METQLTLTMMNDELGKVKTSKKSFGKIESIIPWDTYNPRHHGTHYHVEYRIDTNKSWNNKRNVHKIHLDGYTPGGGTGFLPGETFPSSRSRR